METKICKKCGQQMSFNASYCPNCGCHSDIGVKTAVQTPQKNKNSGLSIAALILSILGCTFFIGMILAIIDLVKNNGRKKTVSIIALVVCSFWILIIGIGSNSSEQNTNEEVSVQSEVKESTPSPTEEPTPAPTQEPTPTPEPQLSKEEFIASCEEITYKTLARYPEDYIGHPIVITVKIEQILSGGFFDDNQYYRVYTNDEYDLWMGDEYFMYDSRVDDDMRLLEEDIIKVYAEFLGTETVERALTNTKEEVPAFKAMYIELIAE